MIYQKIFVYKRIYDLIFVVVKEPSQIYYDIFLSSDITQTQLGENIIKTVIQLNKALPAMISEYFSLASWTAKTAFTNY